MSHRKSEDPKYGRRFALARVAQEVHSPLAMRTFALSVVLVAGCMAGPSGHDEAFDLSNEDPSPILTVRFTRPVCAPIVFNRMPCPEGAVCREVADETPPDVPAGVHCYGGSEERRLSRERAGIVQHQLGWLEQARQSAADGRRVRITMAYLSWSHDGIYDALCAATAAGARFEGFFDAGNQGSLPPRFAADPACNPQNIEMHELGGLTSHPQWRLMHIKLMMVEVDGEPMTRLAFGSANISSAATSIHFENWMFAEFPSASHFVESHRCAMAALRSAEPFEYPDDAPEFTRAYDACVMAITAVPDPRYQVFFTPDPNMRAMRAIIDEMTNASSRVDMAIQHFTAYPLIDALVAAGAREALETRLVMDDDAYYGDGESAGDDHATYEYSLRDSQIDLRFMQTNARLGVGAQYQHNKFVIVDDDVVFMGAGNFTMEAFSTNYEQFYLFRAPEMATAYRAQFDGENEFPGLWNLAQSVDKLPRSWRY